jgi:hypothetical protein
MEVENTPDFVAMTGDEMDEWVAAEEAKTPFTSFDLGTDAGRQGLLRKYFMIGDTSLFEAVSHVWASLNEPRAARCTAIGLAAGTGGKGKRGVVLALHKFLAEALETINWIPPINEYPSLEAWHEACKRTYTDEEADLCVVLERYSTLLNCGEVDPVAAIQEAVVLQGPWKAPVTGGAEHTL